MIAWMLHIPSADPSGGFLWVVSWGVAISAAAIFVIVLIAVYEAARDMD